MDIDCHSCARYSLLLSLSLSLFVCAFVYELLFNSGIQAFKSAKRGEGGVSMTHSAIVGVAVVVLVVVVEVRRFLGKIEVDPNCCRGRQK